MGGQGRQRGQQSQGRGSSSWEAWEKWEAGQGVMTEQRCEWEFAGRRRSKGDSKRQYWEVQKWGKELELDTKAEPGFCSCFCQ
jgi:hypothetical protein